MTLFDITGWLGFVNKIQTNKLNCLGKVNLLMFLLFFKNHKKRSVLSETLCYTFERSLYSSKNLQNLLVGVWRTLNKLICFNCLLTLNKPQTEMVYILWLCWSVIGQVTDISCFNPITIIHLVFRSVRFTYTPLKLENNNSFRHFHRLVAIEIEHRRYWRVEISQTVTLLTCAGHRLSLKVFVTMLAWLCVSMHPPKFYYIVKP